MGSYEIEASQEQLTAVAEGLKIEAYADGMIEVWFENGLALPEKYHFTTCDTSDAEAEKVLDYLAQEYSDLIGFSQPEKVSSVSYSLSNDNDGEEAAAAKPRRETEYMLYDSAGNDLKDLLSYSYHYVRFYPDNQGKLSLIRIYDGLSCAEQLGDYPVITIEEAYELLMNGNYITSVPCKITDAGSISMAELVYRSSRTEETYPPYYRFYAELPDTRQENGLKDFGAYYVPAVRAEYIANMPLWDGEID